MITVHIWLGFVIGIINLAAIFMVNFLRKSEVASSVLNAFFKFVLFSDVLLLAIFWLAKN